MPVRFTGCNNTGYFFIDDRSEAIEFTLGRLVSQGDTVVLCGKGHEQSLNLGEKEVPWSDFKAAKEILEK